jgi:hypothetical protein
MKARPATKVNALGESTLLRRAFSWALALSLVLGLLFIAASNHAAVASPAVVSSAVATDMTPDLAEGAETGSHCHCQAMLPRTIGIAEAGAVASGGFVVSHDRDRPSPTLELLPKPPRV